MDSFGRLPTDVINIVGEMFQKPTINIVQEDIKFILTIKYLYSTQFITLPVPIDTWKIGRNSNVFDTKGVEKLNLFLQELKAYKHCEYTYHHGGFHNINITYNEEIIIDTGHNKIMLDKSCLVLLICALDKYYNTLINMKFDIQ